PLVAATRNRGRYDRRTTEETNDVPPGDSSKANHPDAAPPRARRRAPRRHATPGRSQPLQAGRPGVSDQSELLRNKRPQRAVRQQQPAGQEAGWGLLHAYHM